MCVQISDSRHVPSAKPRSKTFVQAAVSTESNSTTAADRMGGASGSLLTAAHQMVDYCRRALFARPQITASSQSAVSEESASKQVADHLADERVARKIMTMFVSHQGVVTIFAEKWHDFYNEAVLSEYMKARGVVYQHLPKLADFLSCFQHVFAVTEKAGGRCTEVRPSLKIGPCRKFLRRDGTCDDERCPKLHCCEFFLYGNCTRGESCQYPHSLEDSHNSCVLRYNLLDGIPIGDLSVLLSSCSPQLCFRYNGKDGCTKAGCSKLHLCRYFVIGECKNAQCVRSHDVLSDQSKQILKRFGFNLTLGPDKTLQKLRSKIEIISNQRNLNEQVNDPAYDESRRPEICYKYNSQEGCRYGDKCHRLHLCKRYAETKGKCSFGTECRSNHDILSPQPRSVLVRCGFDVERGAEYVLVELTSSLLARKSDKGDAPNGSEVDVKDMTKAPQICTFYNKPTGCKNARCTFLHICSHFITDRCKFKTDCKRSHNIRSEQALSVLKECGLDMAAMSDDEILKRLKPRVAEKDSQPKDAHENFKANSNDRKNQIEVPHVCNAYNKGPAGCRDAKCRFLHLCQHYISGNCKFANTCKRSHNVRSEQPLNLLRGCGLDLAAKSDEQIISLLKQPRSEEAAAMHTAVDDRQKRDARRTDKPPASGDREEKVCSFYLSGRCNYGDKCLKYHSSSGVPYQWQYLVSSDQNVDEWRDFAPTTNVHIESRYCDVTEESCETTDDGIGERVRIDFNQWLVFGIGNSESTTEVRRLGTDSAVTSSKRNRYSTVWLWYWQKDDGLWQAFADVETANEDNVGSSRNKTLNDKSGPGARDGAVSFQNEPTSSDIELLYLENQNSKIRYQRAIGSDNLKFLINNLAMMAQTNMNTGASNKLRRRPQLFREPEKTSAATPSAVTSTEQKIIYPSCWDLAVLKDESQDFVKVPLMNSGQTAGEYRGIAGHFEATMPGVAIKTIYRIQNSELWEEFDAFQTRMNRKRSSPARVERLFHETDRQFVDAICQQGFDWRLNGKSVGAVYGKGSYFARTAKFSKDYTRTGTMFVVKVIVGEYTKGDGSMVRPPPKDPNKPFQDLYDSCVNDVSNPEIFVVFERRQAYPEYLIEF